MLFSTFKTMSTVNAHNTSKHDAECKDAVGLPESMFEKLFDVKNFLKKNVWQWQFGSVGYTIASNTCSTGTGPTCEGVVMSTSPTSLPTHSTSLTDVERSKFFEFAKSLQKFSTEKTDVIEQMSKTNDRLKGIIRVWINSSFTVYSDDVLRCLNDLSCNTVPGVSKERLNESQIRWASTQYDQCCLFLNKNVLQYMQFKFVWMSEQSPPLLCRIEEYVDMLLNFESILKDGLDKHVDRFVLNNVNTRVRNCLTWKDVERTVSSGTRQNSRLSGRRNKRERDNVNATIKKKQKRQKVTFEDNDLAVPLVNEAEKVQENLENTLVFNDNYDKRVKEHRKIIEVTDKSKTNDDEFFDNEGERKHSTNENLHVLNFLKPSVVNVCDRARCLNPKLYPSEKLGVHILDFLATKRKDQYKHTAVRDYTAVQEKDFGLIRVVCNFVFKGMELFGTILRFRTDNVYDVSIILDNGYGIRMPLQVARKCYQKWLLKQSKDHFHDAAFLMVYAMEHDQRFNWVLADIPDPMQHFGPLISFSNACVESLRVWLPCLSPNAFCGWRFIHKGDTFRVVGNELSDPSKDAFQSVRFVSRNTTTCKCTRVTLKELLYGRKQFLRLSSFVC